jgi:hypothetical protein
MLVRMCLTSSSKLVDNTRLLVWAPCCLFRLLLTKSATTTTTTTNKTKAIAMNISAINGNGVVLAAVAVQMIWSLQYKPLSQPPLAVQEHPIVP